MNAGAPVPPEVLAGLRVDLRLVTIEQLEARFASDGPVPLGFSDPSDVLAPERAPLKWRVPQVREDPACNPWLLRLIVWRERGEIVGHVGFHAPPDAAGMVEIGYTILETFRRHGFGREAALTMWAFAANHPNVRVLRATVAPDNEPSLRIIEGAGFARVGEQIDPEDGLELVYEMSAADFACRR